MLTIEQALEDRWYYTVELSPGQMTKGFSFKNISVTRKALESLGIANCRVLDVSTMEGMFPVLMTRRGATVTATDSISLPDKIALLKEVYDVSFDYVGHAPVKNYADFIFDLQASSSFTGRRPLAAALKTGFGFDMVLASGLIYHVANPIDHLITYRKLTKSGGVLVLETATLLSDEIEIVHDWRGEKHTYGGRATWFVSTRALDVWLRACFFEPLGFAYVPSKGASDLPLARIAIVARAVEERRFPDEVAEKLATTELYSNYDFKPLYPAAQLTGQALTPPVYTPGILHPADDLSGSAIGRREPLEFPPDYLTLRLADG